MIRDDQALGHLLCNEALAHLKIDIEVLAAEPPEQFVRLFRPIIHHTPHSIIERNHSTTRNAMNDVTKALEMARDKKMRRLLMAWTDPQLACGNGKVADFNLAFAGCTRSNSNAQTLGAGAAALAAGIYQGKYTSKSVGNISASATLIIQAQKYIKDHPSVAQGEHPSGTAERDAMHLAQYMVNHSDQELTGTQAAAVVLNYASSFSSVGKKWHTGSQFYDLVRIAADNPGTESVDFSMPTPAEDPEEMAEEDDGNLADKDFCFEGADKAKPRKVAADITMMDARNREFGGAGYAQVYKTKGKALFSNAKDVTRTVRVNAGKSGRVTVDGVRSAVKWIGDFTIGTKTITSVEDKIGGKVTLSDGTVFENPDAGRLPVSAAEHYGLRDVRLIGINAAEFTRAFTVRQMTEADRKWSGDAKMPAYDMKWLENNRSDGAPASSNVNEKAGRPCGRYRLLPPHLLCSTHIIVENAKYGMTAWAGSAPPKPPSSVQRQRQKKGRRYDTYRLANFVPWHMQGGFRLGEANSPVSEMSM